MGRWTKGLVPNAITYSALISACAKDAKAARALELVQAMRDQGLVPNVSYSAWISTCAKCDKAAGALELSQKMPDTGLGPKRHHLPRLGQCLRRGRHESQGPGALPGKSGPKPGGQTSSPTAP